MPHLASRRRRRYDRGPHIDLQDQREQRARRNARAFLFEFGYLPFGAEALLSVMDLPATDIGELTAYGLRGEILGPEEEDEVDDDDVDGAA